MSSGTRKSKANEGEFVPVSSKRRFPPAPFPCKYMHCVIDELYSLVQVVHALRADGSNACDIHVMTCWDYVDAVTWRQQQQSRLSKMLMRLLSFFDDGFGKVYLHEANRGHHILMMRLSDKERLEQVLDMLACHDARLIKYVDTWTVTDLSVNEWHSPLP